MQTKQFFYLVSALVVAISSEQVQAFSPQNLSRRTLLQKSAFGTMALVTAAPPAYALAAEENNEKAKQEAAEKKKQKAEEEKARRMAEDTKKRLAVGRIGTI